MKRPKSLPRFRDEDAEREFWAREESADYLDWSRAKRVVFPNLKPSTRTISLRLPESLLADLKVLAHRIDTPYQSLMKVYLAERVMRELRESHVTDGNYPASKQECEFPLNILSRRQFTSGIDHEQFFGLRNHGR